MPGRGQVLGGCFLGTSKKIAFIVIGWFLLLIPGIIIIELLFGGWIIEDEWRPASQINVLRHYEVHFDIAHLYPHEQKIVIYKRDENGLRMDCMGPENVDILTVGGSTTDQTYLHLKDTFQSVLGQKLSKDLGQKICIANAGIDGHSSWGHLLSFKHWFPAIKNLKPKHIIFYVGINDANFGRLIQEKPDYDVRPKSLMKYIYKQSAFAGMAIYIKHAILNDGNRVAYGRKIHFKPAQYTEATLTPGTAELARKNALRFRERMQHLVAHAKRLGARAICVTQPHRLAKDGKGIRKAFPYNGKIYNGLDYDYSIRQLNAQMQQVCGAENVIDLYGADFSKQDFYDYVHTTDKGARKIAERLYEAYRDQGLDKDLVTLKSIAGSKEAGKA